MPLGTQVEGHATTYEILKEGSGNGIAKGQNATVHARGEISGKKFWDTKVRREAPSPLAHPPTKDRRHPPPRRTRASSRSRTRRASAA